MNTERENNHGEYWPSPFAITFNVKKVWAWIVSFFLMSGICYAQQYQLEYYGSDATASLVAKTTANNISLYSQELDNALWIKLGATATANTITAPDGTLTADTLTATAGNAAHYFYANAGNRPAAGTTERLSLYVKPGTSSFIGIYENGGTLGIGLTLNLSGPNPVASLIQGVSSYSITSVRDGWYRVVINYTRVDGATRVLYVSLRADTTTAGTTTTWTAAGTETAHIWGIQLNNQSDSLDYVLTTAASATFGPQCGEGFAESFIDPSRCFPVRDNRFRAW